MTKETRAEYAARHWAEAATSRPVRIAALAQDITRMTRPTPPEGDHA